MTWLWRRLHYLCLLPLNTEMKKGAGNIEGKTFAWWSEMEYEFQRYYDVINVVHLRFPELLPLSRAQLQSVAFARSQTPSPTGHSNNPHQSNLVLTGVRWKRINKEKGKEETKPKKKLVKQKESKEERDGSKKTEAVKGKTKDRTEETEKKNDTPKLNKTETGNGNNTRKESSPISPSIHSDAFRSSTSSTSPKITKEEKSNIKRWTSDIDDEIHQCYSFGAT
ncbi:hypothetical protein BYT27DRAFT_7253437 [Phlegmacium glaucopus]|nr:hypothetical protein BYT27DRAFT_7253437 [Phlegmacium glaucopus]